VSALVRRGEADVGLRYFPDPDPKLESLALGAERLFVVVPAQHRITARRVAHVRAFEGEKWLTFPPDPRQPETFGQLERRLLAVGIARPSIALVDSLTAQKRLVEAGLGIALLPASSFREELRLGTLRTVDIADFAAEQPVVVLRRRSSQRSPLAGAFVELLQRDAVKLLGRGRRVRVTGPHRPRTRS